MPPLPDGINEARVSVIVHGEERPFTRGEWMTLSALRRAEGRILSEEALIEQVWPGSRQMDPHTVAGMVSRVRTKLTGSGWTIVRRYGLGWIFEKVKS